VYATFYSNPFSLVTTDTATLLSAKSSIDAACYALDDNQLVSAFLAAANAGVKVRLYLDRTELEASARGDATLSRIPLGTLVGHPNVTIKVKFSSILMHLKSYLVDGSTLRDGSANFSPEGEEKQDNSLILSDDPHAIAAFAAKFDSMWNRPDNLSVSEAVASHPVTHHRPLYH
jgi:phosphatidylserine/phosphatidylglycerophosphate/cardiolipin synthase-like enzyme